MPSTRFLATCFIAAVASFSCHARAAVPPSLSDLLDRQPTANGNSPAGLPWVIGVVATESRLAPAALLGLRADEVLHVEADDPAHVDVVARALERWGSPVVLVVADTAEDGRILQKTLLEQCRPLGDALIRGGTSLELVTVDPTSGTFTFRGPHPRTAELIAPQPPATPQPPAQPEPTADDGTEAVLASGSVGIAALESVASLPVPQLPLLDPVAPPTMAAAPVEGGGGNLMFALSGLLAAVGVIIWTQRDRLFPDGLPAVASWLPPGRARLPGSRQAPAPGLPGPRFHSSNARLTAAVNRLYDKLQA